MKYSLTEIENITSGKLFGKDIVAHGLSTDTRTLSKGELFVALSGENYDAHEFISTGKASLAAGVIVDRKLEINLPQIVVNDTCIALQDIARAWRNNFSIPVIGITGSNGKTSVKEFIKYILFSQGNVLATVGNLNNHIGVPLTLLNLDQTHNFAVIEMGANHAGEIATLASIACPNIGVITNIGPAHLEGFGSLQGVADAKSELYQNLSTEGIAVVNADEPFRHEWHEKIANRMQITFGVENSADVIGKVVDIGLIEIFTPIGEARIELKTPGLHSLYNALAAAAVCIGVGIDIEFIKAGIESTEPVAGRLIRLKGIGGSRLIDDTYNANPASLLVALETQSQESGEHWLVLGDMGELGEQSIELHTKAGIMAKEFGVKRLFAVGELAKHAVTSFGKGGEHFASHAEITKVLQDELVDNISVLIKGSRAMHLEEIVTGIKVNKVSNSNCNEHAA